MHLNNLSPIPGQRRKRKRVGRGIGSGLGKTCGRGHKGQKSRTGGFHKIGFEGGQMPLQRRLPKVGFRSVKALVRDQILTRELHLLSGDLVDLNSLREAGLINRATKQVKLVYSGNLDRAFNVRGLGLTKGAREAIVAAGGSVED